MRFVIHFLTCKCDWKPWLEDRPFLFRGKLAYVSWTLVLGRVSKWWISWVMWLFGSWFFGKKDPWTFVHISIKTQKLPYLKGVTDLRPVKPWLKIFLMMIFGMIFHDLPFCSFPLASGPRFSNFSFLSPFWVDFDPKEVGKPQPIRLPNNATVGR